MLRDYSILIGARGWIHPDWETEYYPDDLPQDWQLGYYSNDFPVVMLTRKEWQLGAQTGEGAVANWLDESEASLRFVVELDSEHADITKWRAKLNKFGNRLLGVVLIFDALPSPERLRTLCVQWQMYFSVCVDFTLAEPGEELIEVMRDVKAGWCWHGEGNSAGLNVGALVIARIGTKDKTPRDLRAIVETLLAVDSVEERVLLFDGSPPSIEVMKNAGIILDLL